MRRAVVAAVIVTSLAAMGVAQAAGLDVSAGSITPFEPATACTDRTVEVTPGDVTRQGVAESVVVTVPEECAGVTGRLSLVEASGAREVELTAAPGETTVAVDPYPAGDVAGAALVLAGWGVPTTWSYTPAPLDPVYPGDEDTVTSEPQWQLSQPTSACVTVDVTTDSAEPVEWRVELDLSLPPFNGVTQGYSLSDTWAYTLHPATPSEGYLQVRGNPQAGTHLVTAGTTRTFELCNWGLAPADQPSAYSVTTEPTGTWTDTRACMITTVAGNGTSPFWFVWSATVDLQPAADHLAAAGRNPVGYQWGDGSWSLLRTPAPETGPYAWHVVEAPYNALRGTDTASFEVCVLGG